MFKFIYEGEDYRNELTVEECGLTHMEVAEWFNQFLRGCGYRYNGEYDLITREEETILARYYREKDKAEFMDKVFGDPNIEAAGTFPVI